MKYFFQSDLIPEEMEVSIEYAVDFINALFSESSRVDIEHDLSICRHDCLFMDCDKHLIVRAEDGVDYGFCPVCRWRIDYFNNFCRCKPQKSVHDLVSTEELNRLYPPKPFIPNLYEDKEPI